MVIEKHLFYCSQYSEVGCQNRNIQSRSQMSDRDTRIQIPCKTTDKPECKHLDYIKWSVRATCIITIFVLKRIVKDLIITKQDVTSISNFSFSAENLQTNDSRASVVCWWTAPKRASQWHMVHRSLSFGAKAEKKCVTRKMEMWTSTTPFCFNAIKSLTTLVKSDHTYLCAFCEEIFILS